MMQRIEKSLLNRIKCGRLRQLVDPCLLGSGKIDFSSNDYIGLSRDITLSENIRDCYDKINRSDLNPINGSSGSRLLTGNSEIYVKTENLIAKFHGYNYCLLANSGWDLNYGLMSCIPNENTTVYYDELCHNSLISGMKVGRQKNTIKFKHNNIKDLEITLQNSKRNTNDEILIVVESLYSMDGDICPIQKLLEIAQKHHAYVIVDEAHSTGVYGIKGEGLICSLGLNIHPNLLGVVHTFGKAIGCHGASFVTQHSNIITYLLNYCHPLIYSTSLPTHTLISIQQAYQYMETLVDKRIYLFDLVRHFKMECDRCNITSLIPSDSPIQGILVPGNENVKTAAQILLDQGYLCLPIRAPTVEEGKERLRIVLHSHNTKEDVSQLCYTMSQIKL
jgi:8-amino-7-oxononanoate synthase